MKLTKQPRYPIIIISKGRSQYGHTMKCLDSMGVDYKVVVEPQECDAYANAFGKEKIIEAPFSNHGKGSGPARNFAWDWSIAEGYERHWLMDDNIMDFWRLHKNKRYRVAEGSGIFRAAEDFVDRYENIALAGFQYKFFAIDGCAYPPYILNTRIMSCFLIDNSCTERWRGRYNEDVDLSIRVMKEGYVSMLFYAFLCGKMRTGTVKGGNTTEIYNDYKDDASLKKSQMLKEMHPDCVELVEKYGRTHHHVDLDKIINRHTGQPARHNALILKKDVDITPGVNNYGMELARNWGTDDQVIDPSFSLNEYPKGRKGIHGMSA